MKRYRPSMATLMAVVAAAAVDFWIVRSLEPGSTTSHVFFVTGVMPVASLLILVALVSSPQLIRSGASPHG